MLVAFEFTNAPCCISNVVKIAVLGPLLDFSVVTAKVPHARTIAVITATRKWLRVLILPRPCALFMVAGSNPASTALPTRRGILPMPGKAKPPLGGLGFRLLKPVEKIDGALRVRCGLHDGALVVLEYVDPRRDVGGVVVANLRSQFQVGAEES
jgi:hypothetical protein